MWDHLLDEPVVAPVVLMVHSGREFGWPDGTHRLAASILTGRPTIPAVVGLAHGMTEADLPEVLRAFPEMRALVASLPAARPGLR